MKYINLIKITVGGWQCKGILITCVDSHSVCCMCTCMCNLLEFILACGSGNCV